MDKQLHVVKGKLLNVVPEMIFLIHPLKESQGSSPDLEKNTIGNIWDRTKDIFRHMHQHSQ